MTNSLFLLVAVFGGSGSLPPMVEDTVVVSGEITCSDCSIDLTPEVVLGADDGDGLLADGMAENVVLDSRGAYWVWSAHLPSHLWRFEAPESVRILGREGQGPGELSGIFGVTSMDNGRLLVVDKYNQRLSQLDPDGNVVSEARFVLSTVGMMPPVQVAGDTMVISAPSSVGPRLGVPIHLFDASTGEVFQEIGEGVEIYDRQQTSAYQVRLLDVDRPHLIAGHQWRYQIDLYHLPGGQKAETFLRSAAWFQPVDIAKVNPPSTDPAASMIGIAAIPGAKQALVLLRRPREGWRAGYEGGSPTVHGKRAVSRALIYETVIEWIDLDDGSLLATITVPGIPLSFVDHGSSVAVLDDTGLTPRIRVFRVELGSARTSTNHLPRP